MRGLGNLRYVSGDPDAERGTERIDLTALALPDGSFDLVIAFHVLEHVEDDAAAFREIHRVLRPGGVALLQVPTRPGPTFEDPSVRSPGERLAAFGQEDHVRVYGDDFAARVRASGLSAEDVVYRDAIPEPERVRHGLLHTHAEDPLDPRLWTFVRAEKVA